MIKSELRTYFLFLFCVICGCGDDERKSIQAKKENTSAPTTINYAVTRTYPHDTSLFTEGLLIHEGRLFESTGSPKELVNTKSLIGTVELTTGIFNKRVELDKSYYFGEGIVVFKNKIYQLTYKNQVGFIYDASTFERIGTFNYVNEEGWGFTTNGKELIMSDGTDQLTFLDPESLRPTRKLNVSDNSIQLKNLNELEYIKGFIYANIWTTNYIVKIDPQSGKVMGKLDLTSLAIDAKNKNPNADVLNGIAYDSTSNKIYITGKLWPNIYEITFAH